MTVELAVIFPLIILIAVITVNALTFFSECAAFDRIAREAVRVHATAPVRGEDSSAAIARVQETLESQFDQPFFSTEVAAVETGLDVIRYTATLSMSPTLFGRGTRSTVFGVPLPRLTHRAVYVVDPYRPGVVV